MRERSHKFSKYPSSLSSQPDHHHHYLHHNKHDIQTLSYSIYGRAFVRPVFCINRVGVVTAIERIAPLDPHPTPLFVRQPGPTNHTLYIRNPQANICTFSDQATKLSGIEMDAKASKTLAAETSWGAHTYNGLLETMFHV